MPHVHTANHGHRHVPEPNNAFAADVDQPQTPALLVLGALIALFGGGLWYKLHSKNTQVAERLANEEYMRQQAYAAQHARNNGLGLWVLVPSAVCFVGLVYKCLRFSERGQRQMEENMKTGMIVGAIFAIFGMSIFVKQFFFPDKPPPDPSVWSEIAEHRTTASALLMIAAAFCGYSIMSYNNAGRRTRHNRHRHHRRRAR